MFRSHHHPQGAQFCRTDIFKKSVINLGTKLYNKLPNYIKKLIEFKTF